MGCIQEYSGASLVRTTKRYYAANDVDTWTWGSPPTYSETYLVDRMWGENHYDGSGGLLSVTH